MLHMDKKLVEPDLSTNKKKLRCRRNAAAADVSQVSHCHCAELPRLPKIFVRHSVAVTNQE